MIKGVVIWAAVSFAALLLAGVLAGRKNRDYSFWMSWGFIFPPSVLLLALLPKLKGLRPTRPPADDLYHEDLIP